ncbi:hypothetical protein PHYSODRAFT_324986 [Phytophthora sojae]|uniref:HTH CENPB-type domain-containing protein n=1 Tax=Phytophthora sojae (strain P6497) TaxID=1094619 RepID=G4YWT7_PHYSP|nr:hypothetical protein PHYSODRAFT_324986 [Phytophthora sojae]EGZ23807.1 hypothetical protein PHYSODRAFT_324986 [Phytophthora sojae]|eukprot:XP_009519095.1 hypothetical protein PHYSODRAFT_324986 [Phytophthora sojae]
MARTKPRPVGRPRLNGKGRYQTKHIKKSVSVAKKLEVLSFWANAPKPKMKHTIAHFWHDLAPEFYNSKRTMIQRWRRESAKLEATMKNSKGKHLKEGVPVSPRMLALQARRVAAEAGIRNFRSSDKWIQGFRGRHRMSMRVPTRQSQISPEDIAKVKAEFATEVEKMARQLGITRIYNADQTVFKMKPSKNPAIVKENNEKRCGFGTRTWPEIRKLIAETGLQIYANGKEPVLLLWDDFSGHWTAEVLAYAASIRVVLLKVPPHATWESLSSDTIANGYKKCDLHLNEECLAAASLVAELQNLSLVGPVAKAVDQTQDFDRNVILDEVVV